MDIQIRYIESNIWTLIALILTCAFMFSAGTGAYAASGSQGDPGTETAEISDGSLHPASSIAFLREWIEENNRMDEEMEQQGYHAVKKQLYLSLTEDAEPYAQVGTVAAEANGIHATVVMRVEESDSDESSAFDRFPGFQPGLCYVPQRGGSPGDGGGKQTDPERIRIFRESGFLSESVLHEGIFSIRRGIRRHCDHPVSGRSD